MKSIMAKISGPRRDLLILAIICIGFFIGMATNNKYYMNILIDVAYFATVATAWNIMCGFTGQLSLGHGAFLGTAQYTCVLLYTQIGLTPWVGMFLGGLAAMILACLIGLLALRLKSHFFTLSTIALTFIMQVIAVKATWLTKGSSGITVPYEPSIKNMIFESSKVNYLMFVILLIIVLLTTIYIRHAKIGSNLIAIRENDIAAASLGINLYKNKVIALMISAFFTSIAGCLYVQHILFINPSGAFDLFFSIKIAILSIVGGIGTVFGPVLGSVILTPTEIALRANLGGTMQGVNLFIYGIILVVVILLIPNGIVGTIAARFRHKESLRIEQNVSKKHEV